MTALAVNRRSTMNGLPRIGNGKLVVFKEPAAYPREPFISLPPLPNYTIYGIARKRWGEDEAIIAQSKLRNNFDSCHPVSEDPNYFKFEGYMFPKPLHQDVQVLPCAVSNTGRRVPRKAHWEMFPRNDTHRSSVYDGYPVLGEATRKAIEENVTNLYRTTRYNSQFKDTTRFMIDKARRDAQYNIETPDNNKSPTCRVHCHPDPCKYCWHGGYNKDFEAEIAEFQSRQYSLTKLHPSCCHGNSEMHSSQTDEQDSDRKRHSIVIPSKQECCCLLDSCNICSHNNKTTDAENNAKNRQLNGGDAIKDSEKKEESRIGGETTEFGPWQDYAIEHEPLDEQLILADVYKCKLPSTVNCLSSEIGCTAGCRHTSSNLGNQSADQWQSLYRTKMDASLPLNRSQARNSWTYRDINNLRIPCIADVLGSSHKSDAHKRYHLEHNEPIPDLREHWRYSRRVQFYGFNSSVFR